MPRIFYRGKLPILLKIGMAVNNSIAWINGNARDKTGIKKRVQEGYEGIYSDDVTKYDALSLWHYEELAQCLLEKVDCKNKTVLDVGCGTGILSKILLERGAAKVVCMDFSQYMIDQCKNKFKHLGISPDRVDYKQADAEKIPFEDNSFDIAVSGMVLGMILDQNKFLSELHRIIKPGGEIAVSTHGPEWYYENVEALSMCLMKNYPITNFGSSGGVEFWPLTDSMFAQMLKKNKFINTHVNRHKGQLSFNNGEEAWQFFAACSSAWYIGVFEPEKRKHVINKIRDHFSNKQITNVTYDALMGYGLKK